MIRKGHVYSRDRHQISPTLFRSFHSKFLVYSPNISFLFLSSELDPMIKYLRQVLPQNTLCSVYSRGPTEKPISPKPSLSRGVYNRVQPETLKTPTKNITGESDGGLAATATAKRLFIFLGYFTYLWKKHNVFCGS